MFARWLRSWSFARRSPQAAQVVSSEWRIGRFHWPLTIRFLPFLESIFRHVAGGAVIFVRQEFSGHRDLDAISFRIGHALHHHVEIDRRHDAVAEFLLD